MMPAPTLSSEDAEHRGLTSGLAGLPKSIGNHQTYWLWGYRDYTGESILVLGDSLEDAARACVEVEAVGEVYHPYSMPCNHFPIVHCRGLREPVETMWPRLRNWN